MAELGIDGSSLEETLAGLAPDVVTWIEEFAFGDVHARPGLDARSRQIVIISALTTLGTAAAQLPVHVRAGLHAGLSRQEIVEAILQVVPYAGFPAVLNALEAARPALDGD